MRHISSFNMKHIYRELNVQVDALSKNGISLNPAELIFLESKDNYLLEESRSFYVITEISYI